MFADYGGIAKDGSTKRWHLPEHLSWQGPQAIAAKEAVVEPGKISLLEEELAAKLAAAEENGRNKALIEATEKQTQRMAEIEARMQNVLQDMVNQLNEELLQVEKSAVDLAIEISKKIVNYAVEINPEYLLELVRQALKQVGGATVRKIRISPQDSEFIEIIGVARFLKEFDGSWQFESDDSIKTGCVVETSAGEIDYQLDAAWERVKDEILKVTR